MSMAESNVVTPATHTVKSAEGKREKAPVHSRPAAVSREEALPYVVVLGISAQSHDLK